MNWEEFKELKALLNKTAYKTSLKNSTDVNSVKGREQGTCYVVSLVPVLNSLTEENFSDLTYRYIITDKELESVKVNLQSLSL